MVYTLHKNDLPTNIALGNIMAIDTETMGLNPLRDRLCLIQLSSGDGNAHLVAFDGKDYSAPNLRKLLSDKNFTSIFHFARFDVAVLKHYLDVDLANIYSCSFIETQDLGRNTDGKLKLMGRFDQSDVRGCNLLVS
jgi:ribonuclease D